MKTINFAGAVLLVALCVSSVSGQACTSADYKTFSDGTDFFGNDLQSIPDATVASCITACEQNDACYAIVLKVDNTCWLKDSNYYADVRVLTTTQKAVDLSCLRGGAPPYSPVMPATPGTPTTPATPATPGTPTTPATPATPGTPGDGTGTDSPPSAGPVTNADGTVTVTSTEKVMGGAYVTTQITYNPLNFNSDTTDDVPDSAPTAVSFYSDSVGNQFDGVEAIANPEVTVTGQDITATTTVTDQTDPIVTTVSTDPTTGGALTITSPSGTTPTAPAPAPGMEPPAAGAPATTPPGSMGTIGNDATTGYTNMVNTVMVPNTEPPKYVTMNTTVDSDLKVVPDQSRAYYSDANGVPVAGQPDIPMNTTSDPAAVYPAPIVTSTVAVPDDSGATQTLTSSAYQPTSGSFTTYGANAEDVANAPMMPPAVMMPPSATGMMPPPPSRAVNVTTTPEKGAATGLQMVSAALAISMFAALML